MDNDTEITINGEGVISGLEPVETQTEDGWTDDAGAPAPAAAPAAAEPAPEADEGEGESEVAAEDEGWDEPAAAPAAKQDQDDVPPEDRDPKGKVPSWRVREIREAKDREIQRLQAELDQVRGGASKPAQTQSTQPAARAPQTEHDALIQEITESDPVVQELDAKLAAVQHLVETAPEELVKYFRNADHMALEVAKWTATRQSRIDGVIARRDAETRQAQEQEQRQAHEHIAKVITDYDTAIKSSKIPDCAKYAQRLATNASKLNVGIRELLITSDEPDVLTAAIGSNRKLFDELAAIDPSKPMSPAQLAKVALRLGKAVAAYQMPKQSVVDEPEPAPQRAVQPTATRRASRVGTHVPRYRVDGDGTIVM